MKATFALKSRLKYAEISPKFGCKIFDQIIKPICMYDSEIWGTSLINKKNTYDFFKSWDNYAVEKLHTNLCRYVLEGTIKELQFQ